MRRISVLSNRRVLLWVGILLVLIFLVSLAGCNTFSSTTKTPPQLPVQITPEYNPSNTPEIEPLKTLTICLAEEPKSLYIYDGRQGDAKLNVLASIYDGPIDRNDSQLVPVILDNIPTLENGGLTLESVVVTPGQQVIDANGEMHAFREGVYVRPSGCQQSECAITWGGAGDFEMDVMVMTFTLVDGLMWSDGVALSASDSLYSYQLASNNETPGSRWAIDRTVAYQALDQKTIIWKGLPGFSTSDVDLFFWSPLPEHAWSELAPSQLLVDDRSNKAPLAWGAYMINNWKSGTQIELHANPYYFRVDEGLPYFDRLIYKVIPDADAALTALTQGECDILSDSYQLENRLPEILAAEAEGLYDVHITNAFVWEGLTFGITPASYDDGYTPIYGDRLDYFGDSRTRQAFAYCVDRQRIVDEVLLGMSEIPQGLMPNMDTSSESQSQTNLYDPNLGNQLLDLVGWKDVDANPETPRQAWGINGLPSGSLFEIVLLTTPSIFHFEAAQIIQDSLAECGVQVTLETLAPQDLYAPGPDGPLFGRQFDLALFSWNSSGRNDCGLYQSWQVPTKINQWIGTNLGGFTNDAFDQVCNDAKLILLDSINSTDASNLLLKTFLDEAPVIPIAYGIDVIISRIDVQGVLKTPILQGDFFSLEEFFRANP